METEKLKKKKRKKNVYPNLWCWELKRLCVANIVRPGNTKQWLESDILIIDESIRNDFKL